MSAKSGDAGSSSEQEIFCAEDDPVVFTERRRAAYLDARKRLPPAARRPPYRCANKYVLDRLGPDGNLLPVVRSYLLTRRAWLEDRARAYIQKIGPRWPETHCRRATFETMVWQTCTSGNSRYSLAALVQTLHRQAKRPRGFEILCARDHYVKYQAAKYFQLNLTLGLIDNMDEEGVLPKEPCTGVDCGICLAIVEDRPGWCHLEPCRHLICATCAVDYLQSGCDRRCPECRASVIDFVPVNRPARLSRGR